MKTKKIIATILILSVSLSAAGCSGKFISTMTDTAEKACDGLVAGNYKKVKSCLEDENEDLQEAMEQEIEDETNSSASDIIMSTMTYEIDEDSIDSDPLGREGTIDVTFSIVDYESILDENDVFRDIEGFEEAVSDCKDTIDTTITLEFEKSDGEPVIVNSDDLIDLFSFKDVEITLSGSLLDHIEDDNWVGSALVGTSEYIDTDKIELVIDLDELGTELEWEYSYDVQINGNYMMYESDTLTKPAGSSTIDIVYEDDEFEDMEYVITLYEEGQNGFFQASCEISHTEPEPEPATAPISNDVVELPMYLTDTTANPVLLPGGEYQISVPDGFNILSYDDPLVQNTGNTTFGRNICVYMTTARNFEIAAVYIDDPSYLAIFQNDLGSIAQAFADGLPATAVLQEITQEDRTIAGQTVNCYTVHITQGISDSYYTMFLLSGESSNFFIDVSAPTLEDLEAYLGAITHV
ncbi:MAG: hypothetical protein K6F49_02390 [Saccharofermentans sp.]|nr:hypothetical protein [Saccharofermentans sp.]